MFECILVIRIDNNKKESKNIGAAQDSNLYFDNSNFANRNMLYIDNQKQQVR